MDLTKHIALFTSFNKKKFLFFKPETLATYF